MIINHNMASVNTLRQMGVNEGNSAKSLEKLSSGLRINKAGDDAAGLAISEKMRGQIRGLDQAGRNAQDGISLLQTAEGALNETHSILQRMRELGVQSSNDTATADDRKQVQGEVDQLAKEITRISSTTEFNTKKLLNGAVGASGSGEMTFQIGANTNQNMSVSISAMDASSLGVSRISTTAKLDTTNAAKVSSAEGDIGIKTADKLADGNYTVKVASATIAAGGNTVTQTGTGATAGPTVSGTALADTSVVLTYHATVPATSASLAATVAGAPTDTLAFNIGALGAGAGANGVAIEMSDAGVSGSLTASWDNTNNKIVINLSNDTLANNTSANIQAAIRLLGTSGVVTKSDLTTVNLSNLTATGTGLYASTGVAYNGGNMTAASPLALGSLSGGVASIASGWTASGDKTGELSGTTNAVNGLNINVNSIAGTPTAGDKFTIKGYKNETTVSTVQLFNAAGTTSSGAAVTIDKANGGTYTIGDIGKMSVTFDPGAAATGNTTVSIAKDKSSATTFANGQVDQNAVASGGIDVSTQGAASAAITAIDNAIQKVSDQRSKLGAVENRLDHTINNLGTSSENLTAAESRIRDVDMAKEMTAFKKNDILNQAAQAMLAQANQQPQGVLQLLR